MSYGQDVSNVTASKPATGGAVKRAPLGTTLPTDASSTLAAAYINLGYINDDGLTHSFSPSSETVKSWGGDVVYAYSSERPDTYGATFIEALNLELLKVVYGSANVSCSTATGLITVKHNPSELEEAVYVIDEVLRNGALKRTVIPRGKPTTIGDNDSVDTKVTGYDITITCMADSSGNSAYEYILPASTASTASTATVG